MQAFDPPAAESTYSEGGGPPFGGPLSGVGFEALSDWDASERAHHFSEGRRLLLGV